MDKIKRYILNLKDYLIKSLKKLNKEYKRPIIRMITRDMCAVCSNLSLGIVSFNVEGIESIEIAQILSDNNIYVRENNDCMNIQKQFIRVSLGIYNTKQDIDIFIQTLKKIINLRESLEKNKIMHLGKRMQIGMRFLHFLFGKPIVTGVDVQNELKLSPKTANALIDIFVEKGILTETTGFRRNRIFVFNDYLKMF